MAAGNVVVQNLPELGTKHAVDEKVDRGVDDEEDRGDESKDEDPDRETSKMGAPAAENLINNSDLVHVQKDAKCVADYEGSNDHHEHHGDIIIRFSSNNLSPLLHSTIDLTVEEADDSERNDAEYEEPCPVVIPGDIRGGHPQLCHLHIGPLLTMHNLGLKELRKVEEN